MNSLSGDISTIYADKNICLCDIVCMFHVGNLVRLLRELRGWTVEDLARRAGVDKGTVVRIHKNKFKPDSLEKVAAAFRKTTAEMYSITERMNAAFDGKAAPRSQTTYANPTHQELHDQLQEILEFGDESQIGCMQMAIKMFHQGLAPRAAPGNKRRATA